MKKKTAVSLGMLSLALAAGLLTACGSDQKTGAEEGSGEDNKLYVYNWGEYIDESVIDEFEEETGIEVVYDLFETNEEMYPIIEAGAVKYDVICPSDYTIQRMIQNNLLAEINFDNVPNIKEIGPEYMDMAKDFDPENKYAVPYCWGTEGILYNKQRFDELGIPYPTKWADLWNPELEGEILMHNTLRYAFMAALKIKGYSLNTTDPDQLAEARDMLIEQKPLVQAYVIDQVMINGEAAAAMLYSGDLLYIQDTAKEQGSEFDLEYVLPEEGTSYWIDCWVIPANAEHKENAEKWINFLCRPDIAKKNFEYITYATPNKGAFELLDEELQNNKAVFPDLSQLKNSESVQYLGEEVNDVTASLVVAQLLFLEAEDPNKDISLYINSPGGSVTAGMAIYDTMNYIKCDVSTICLGMAASMGAFLLSGGTKGKRYALPNAEVMIHQPSGGARGQATEIQIVAENILRTKKKLNEILAANTGQPYDVIVRDTERDNYMTAEQAKEYGLIDCVITNH